MDTLELTLPTPAENLALDEALLDAAEADRQPAEVLRIWEPPRPMVVLGRTSKWADEVNLEACRRANIPVLRRSSGGAAIVAGPGCLMYAVVLGFEHEHQLRMIDRAHSYVLGRVAAALDMLGIPAARQGTSDLAVAGRKVSGNSLRVKRRHLLYHGTLLYDFPLKLIGDCLRTPPRQPDYRAGRPHAEFVANLPVGRDELTAALTAAWAAPRVLRDWPRDLVAELVETRYGQESWHRQR